MLGYHSKKHETDIYHMDVNADRSSPRTTFVFDNYSRAESRPTPKKSKVVVDAWSVMREKVLKHDEAMVQDWREDMDTLLVFAGLFSAVLTAFAVESYKTLLPTSDSDSTADRFLSLSSAVLVNTMWFSSLILSLVSAPVAILIKQWLHSYMTWAKKSSIESMELRQFCFRGLCAWRVPMLIALVPLVLQFSLVIFLIGLLVLLWALNGTVARVGTAAAAALLFISGVSTIIPSVCVHCPYKAWDLHLILYLLCNACRNPHDTAHRFLAHIPSYGAFTDTLYNTIFHTTPAPPQDTEVMVEWKHRETDAITSERNTLQCDLLAWADSTFMDDDLLTQVIHPILLSVDPSDASVAILRFVLRPKLLPICLDLIQARGDGNDSGNITRKMLEFVILTLKQEPLIAKDRTLMAGEDSSVDSALATRIYMTLCPCLSRPAIQDIAVQALLAANELWKSHPVSLFNSLDITPLAVYSRGVLEREDGEHRIFKFHCVIAIVLGLALATKEIDQAQTLYSQLRCLINDDLKNNIENASQDPMHGRVFPQLCTYLCDWNKDVSLVDESLVRTVIDAWERGAEFWGRSQSRAYVIELQSLKRLAEGLGVNVGLPSTLGDWEKQHCLKGPDLKDKAYETLISDVPADNLRSAIRRSARRVVKQSFLCAV